MKRKSGIYEKIYDINNLRLAHRNARKDKTFYREVKMVDANEDYFLFKIQKSLKQKTYKIKPNDYTVSTIRDKTKTRELWKLKYYPHRIMQRAIMLQLEDIFTKNFTHFTCASVKGRGGKLVQKLMKKYMRDVEGTQYCLKLDLTKYYPSINHKILKKLLRKKFKDRDLLDLLDMVIDSFPGKRGLPIGSYLSQFLANFYLSEFDHRLKEKLKVKYVVRYMDDIVILHGSKKKLRYIYRRVKGYLDGRLNLKIKNNYQIFNVDSRGVDFVGYRYFHGFTLLRKNTCIKFKDRANVVLKKQKIGFLINFREWCSINSYIGWILHCNHYRLYNKYVNPIMKSMNRYYYYVIGNKDKKRLRRYYDRVRSKGY